MEKDKFNKRIGKNIRSIRKAQNITQEQLADNVGTTYQAISKIERGVHPPTVEKLYEICQYINASPNQIIYGDSDWSEWKEESAQVLVDKTTGVEYLLISSGGRLGGICLRCNSDGTLHIHKIE